MIRFFVSSTFVDMAAERDAINQQVLPAVRAYLHHYHGVAEVSTVDLRWGISTEELESESGMKKILSVCMEEIDSCTPHMIILLGERYGSVPSRETISAFLKDAEEGVFSQKELIGKSITEMEIIRYLTNLRRTGADKEMIPAFICLRDPLPYENMIPEDQSRYQSMTPEDIEKITVLRQYMLDHFPEYVLRYSAQWDQENRCVSGLESFVSELTDRMMAALKKELPPNPASEEELQAALDESFEENLLLLTAPRFEYIDTIRTYIRDDFKTIVVRGVSGSGKSCIVSQLADILRKQNDAQVISVHCGNGRFMKNCLDVLRNIVWRLECLTGAADHFSQTRHTYEEWRETAYRLLSEASKERKTVVVIDALNMLQADEHIKTLDFVPAREVGNCCFVLAASDEFSFPAGIIDDEKTGVVTVSTLTDDEITSIIQQQLAGRHKQLPTYAVRAIREAAIYRTPLYLSLLLQRIEMLDGGEYEQAAKESCENGSGEEALYHYIQRMILDIPENEEDLAWHLFETAASKLHFDEVKAFLTVTAILQYGFRLQDYAACSSDKQYKMSLLDLTRFIRYLPFMFSVDSEGRVRFAHQVIEQSIKKHTKGTEGAFLKDLLSYMNQLNDADPIKYTELFNLFLNPESFHVSLDLSVPIQYISRTYLASEWESLHSEKEQDDIHEQDVFEKIIDAIQTIYIRDPQKQNAAFELLSLLCVHASGMSVQTLYGFLSAILFSFDTLFGPEVDRKLIDGLMRRMHSLCISDIYPHANENPLYLRCVYVCAEQCGNRAITYEEKESYYREFLQYASEMARFDNLPEKVTTQWKHDMAVSYGHLAELYVQRDYRRALEYYENAEACLESYRHAVSFDQKKRLFAEQCIQDNRADSANCVIQRARLNRLTGFDPGNWFWPLLDQSYSKLVDAIRFYESNDHIQHRDCMLARYWAISADYCDVKNDPEKQEICIENQMKYARAEYERSRDVLALDQWRNSLLRAALSDRYSYSLEERTSFISQSFALAEQLKRSFAGGNQQVISRILSVTLHALVDLYEKRTAIIQDDDRPIEIKRGEIKELCVYVLGIVSNYMHEYCEGSEGEAENDSLMKLLELSSEMKNQYRSGAIQIINSSNYDRWPDAALMAESAFEIGEALIPYSGTPEAFESQIDTAYCCSVAFHNLHSSNYLYYLERNHLKRIRNGEWKKEAFYEEMMQVYDKILRTSGEYRSRKLQETVRRIDTAQSASSAESWIRFLDYCLKNNKLDRFWELCETCNYRIPGQKLAYLFIIHNDYCSDPEIMTIMPKLGRYFMEHLDNSNVLLLLAKSDVFEALALEEAYKSGDQDAALTILDNQYDHYLELPLLFILRKYNRHEFIKRVADLKPICINKRRKEVRDHQELLTPFFCEEFKRITRELKKK